MKRMLRESAAAVGGRMQGEDRAYDAVSTDSRTLRAGALFVALRGPNFDGAGFVAAAAEAGAAGAIVPNSCQSGCRRSKSRTRCWRCSTWPQSGARISSFRLWP